MRKIYFAIPAIILVIALIPFFIHFNESSSVVCVIGSAKISNFTLPIEKRLHINATEYINVTVKNTGNSAVAICYIRQGSITVPGYDIVVIANGSKYYGSSIPPGVNKLTLLIVGYAIKNSNVVMYLANGQLVELKVF